MDPLRLKDVKDDKVVAYLHELRQQGQSVVEIGDQLLRHVQSGTLPRICEEASRSRELRSVTLQALGRRLADPAAWEQVWAALGGTAGIVDLFARSSVEDVKALAGAIGYGSRKMHKPAAHAAAVDDLLRALVPAHYPGEPTGGQSRDRRPIQHHYARMVRASSLEFLDALIRARDTSNPLYTGSSPERLAKRHGAWMQQQVVGMLSGQIRQSGHLQLRTLFRICVTREPGEATEDRHMSASMAFGMRILRGRLDGTFPDQYWPETGQNELQVLQIVVKKLQKRGRTAKGKVNDLAIFAFELAEAIPRLRTTSQMKDMWGRVFGMWKKDPTQHLEGLVAKGLRWGIGGSQRTIGKDCCNHMTAVEPKRELNWPLLRLYCLHVPDKGVDIDTAQDLTGLGKQMWPYELFEYLLPVVPEKVKRLLQGLLDANPEYSFLSPPTNSRIGYRSPGDYSYGSTDAPSILSMSNLVKQKNFNVDLLLTRLHRDDPDTQKSAAAAVDKLRKSSATARDQPNRAQYAKGAAAMALATGDLRLYAETIEWQQRFVRDPLTVKVIFANDMVGTKEGIELLAGVPGDLPAGCTLDGLVERMDAADKILLTLTDCHKTAKAEPSFVERDWLSVQCLFDSVFRHRYWYLRKVPKRLGVADVDLFAVVWGRTLKMVEALGGRLPRAYQGVDQRARKDRQKEDRILESLSYSALLRLAESDNPGLAHELIVQTILERPDVSSWHRQFLSTGYLKRLPPKDAQAVLLGLARGVGEKLEEQSFVKVGEAEPAKHAPPHSLVKVTTVKHLAQLLDDADFISTEAAVEVLAELLQAATHRDIRIATLHSLWNVLLQLSPGADGDWLSNPLVERVLAAVESIVPVAASVSCRAVTDWDAVSQQNELPEFSDDNSALLATLLTRTWDDKKYDGLAAAYVERIVRPLWRDSIAEHRRWTAFFLRRHGAPLDAFELPDVPTYPNAWEHPLSRHWKRMPFTAMETCHAYTVWSLNRPEAQRAFIASLRADAKLRKQADVVHFLDVYDSRGHYGATPLNPIVKVLESAGQADAQLPRLVDMATEQCSAMLEDYESNIDGWKAAIARHRPPVVQAMGAEASKPGKSPLAAWDSKGRVVLERMAAMVADKKEANRKLGRQSPLPPLTAIRLVLHPFPRVPKDNEEADKLCKEYTTSLRQTLRSLLESNPLQWAQLAQEAKEAVSHTTPSECTLRVVGYLGQLETDATSPFHLSALNLLLMSVASHLLVNGKSRLAAPKVGANNNNKDKDEPSKGRAAEARLLARRLLDMVGTWLQGDELVRDAALEWKRQQKELVAALGKEAA
ncbi:hypothetical protein PG999_012335 [Apiospora kogelbergensis]|uniref:Uncharacterized protein n=1 Tax=Apiospora kogelbergensis TaxID=1337665 RepID=A0AAW0QR90_9PEZI